MKKLSTLVLFALLFMAKNTFGQVDSFFVYPYIDSSATTCITQLYVYASTDVNPETGGVITVDWGDGTSDVFNFTALGNEYVYYDFSHGYTVPGNYGVTTTCYSGTNSAFVGTPQVLPITAYSPGNCGYAYIYTYQTMPSVNYPSVPYDFTGADGTITTVQPGSYNWAYSGLNTTNFPYTVSINDQWLIDNSLVQATADYTITGFNPNGLSNPGTQTMLVTCNAPSGDPDFGVTYSYAWNFVAPLQTGYLAAQFCNYACSDTTNATVTIECPAGFTPDLTGLTNASFVGTTLTYDLNLLSDCVYDVITFSFPGGTAAGTTFCFNVSINGANDSDLTNNNQTVCGVVINSYDPNAKNVNLPTNIDPTTRETLTYDIHFQNDGNGYAYDVVVQDTISANLDLATFQVLGSKHTVSTSVNPTTRVVTFSFNEIYLAPSSNDLDSSQGFVVYSIMENAGLPVDSEIENTAYIYFDFNPAIVTNTTYNVNTVLGIDENTAETITLYPNPAQNSLYFKGAIVKSVSIFDLAGKRVLNAEQLLTNEISIAGIANGIYQVVVATEKGTQTQKLVVRK